MANAPLKVNRYLRDKAMDHIDHALGRPLDPITGGYRNHFATSGNGVDAAAFRASPYWEELGAWTEKAGGMAFFAVTAAGRAALRDYLLSIGDAHRAFDVRFAGHTTAVVAKTAGEARYSYWLDISDCRPDITFKAFCKRARVTLAKGEGARA